jgi:hypothetical protein
MFKALRRRLHLSPATPISIVALVFAMTGGAFAVTGGGNRGGTGSKATSSDIASAAKSKAKGKGNVGLRGPAGPRGATGAAGPAGATGPAGPAGATGPAGQQGSAGATGATGATGEPGAVGKNGINGKNGEPGKEGSPWTDGGTLPVGSTEKGTWSMIYTATAAGQAMSSSISFTVPLAAEPEAHFIAEDEITGNGGAEIAPSIKEGKCKGNAEKPEAASGNLCVFEETGKSITEYLFEGHVASHFLVGTSATGSVVAVQSTAAGEILGLGSWAVTG